MHGVIHEDLHELVVDHYQLDSWKLQDEGDALGPGALLRELDEIARTTGRPVQILLEQLGARRIQRWLQARRSHPTPADSALADLEESLQELPTQYAEGDCPIQILRSGSEEILIRYLTPQGLCGIVRGMVKQLARASGENVYMTDVRCAHRGDPHCEMVVRRVGRPRPHRRPLAIESQPLAAYIAPHLVSVGRISQLPQLP